MLHCVAAFKFCQRLRQLLLLLLLLVRQNLVQTLAKVGSLWQLPSFQAEVCTLLPMKLRRVDAPHSPHIANGAEPN